MRRKIGKLGIIIPIFAVILILCFLTGAGGPSLLEEEGPTAQSGGGTIGIMPLGVGTPTSFGSGDFTWQFDASTGTLTISGKGDMEDFNYNHGTPPPWHQDPTYLAYADVIIHVTINDGVTRIGNESFISLQSLKSVSIPHGVTHIGERAFWDCRSLESVTIPESVKTIADQAFEDCIALKSVDIKNGVESIGERAFFNCKSLESVVIPNSVENIGAWAFAGCESLESVTLPENDGFTNIGTYVFSGCTSLTEITIPDKVTSIGLQAFSGTGLRSVVIPDRVTTINPNAFAGCESLESVTLPENDGFTSIGMDVFSGCTSLTEITIPNTVTSINFTAFANCGLTSVVIPDSVTTILSLAFGNCKNLVHVLVPGDRTSFTFAGDPFAGSDKVIVWAPDGSLAIDEAETWGARTAYLPALDEVIMDEAMDGTLYQYLPYEYVTKTEVPNNYGLEFSITPALPAGLSLADGSASDTSGLIPGTIYGVPTEVVPNVTYTLRAWPRGLTQDIYNGRAVFNFAIKPLSEHPELKDNNSVSTNDLYELIHDPQGAPDNDGHIGVYNTETGRYEITGHIDDVLGDQILYISEADVERFAGLWIDGIEMTRGTSPSNGDYMADRGSTRVTIFEQTIKKLENGEHVAVAAFYAVDPQSGEYTREEWVRFEEGNQLDIVAQKFYVNLERRENGTGGEEPGGGDNNYDYGDYDYGSNDSGVTTPGEEGIADQVRNDEDGVAMPGGTDSGDTAPGGTIPGDTTPGGTAPSATAPDGTAPGAPGGTAPGGTEPGGTAPGGTVPEGTTPGGTAPGGTTPEGTAPGGQGLAPPADGSGTTPAGTAFSGLPVGPDGNFYFDLDGSGNPMILRIDIPFEEFEQLRMNGQAWAPGTDYSATSGSTIITIEADKLDRLDAGAHTLAAVFESETVEIAFTLNKAGPVGASPSTQERAAPSAIGGGAGDIAMPAQNGGALPFIIAGVAVVVLAAAVALIVRKKRAA